MHVIGEAIHSEFEVPVLRLAGVGAIPERKSQHFFNALDFIVTKNISKVNTDILDSPMKFAL